MNDEYDTTIDMDMKSFLDRQDDMRSEMVRKLYNDSSLLKQVAENMVQSSTQIQSPQGFTTFMETRDDFYKHMNKLVADVEQILLRL